MGEKGGRWVCWLQVEVDEEGIMVGIKILRG